MAADDRGVDKTVAAVGAIDEADGDAGDGAVGSVSWGKRSRWDGDV